MSVEEESAEIVHGDGAEVPAVLMATAGYDHSIRFWDVVTGVCTSSLQYNLSQINALALTPDKRVLGAAGSPQTHIFDTASAAGPVRVLDSATGGAVTALGFHPSDPWVFTAGEDGCLRVWDLRAGRCQREVDNKEAINGAVLVPGRPAVLTADRAGSLKVWDLRAAACSAEMIPEEGVSLRSVSVTADASLIAAANDHGRVYVWKEDEGTGSSIMSRSTSPASPTTPSASSYGSLYVPTSKLQAHSTYITKCAFSPCGEYLATASADHTVGLWQFASSRTRQDERATANQDDDYSFDRESYEDEDDDAGSTESMGEHQLVMRHSLEGHLKWAWDCAFSADSAYIVSGSSDNTARLWSVSSGDCIVIYTGHTRAVTAVALNDLAS